MGGHVLVHKARLASKRSTSNTARRPSGGVTGWGAVGPWLAALLPLHAMRPCARCTRGHAGCARRHDPCAHVPQGTCMQMRSPHPAPVTEVVHQDRAGSRLTHDALQHARHLKRCSTSMHSWQPPRCAGAPLAGRWRGRMTLAQARPCRARECLSA